LASIRGSKPLPELLLNDRRSFIHFFGDLRQNLLGSFYQRHVESECIGGSFIGAHFLQIPFNRKWFSRAASINTTAGSVNQRKIRSRVSAEESAPGQCKRW